MVTVGEEPTITEAENVGEDCPILSVAVTDNE